VSPLEIRAQAIRLLEQLAEQYPNQRLGQLLINAGTGDLFYLSDADLALALQRLQNAYSQFKAAGIKP